MMKLIENVKVKDGSTVLIGKPAINNLKSYTPLFREVAEANEKITQIYTPQVFIIGVMDKPRQIVVAVSEENPKVILEAFVEKFLEREVKDIYLWVTKKSSAFLSDVQASNTLIYNHKYSFIKRVANKFSRRN